MTKENFIENYYNNRIAKYLAHTKIRKVLLVGHGMYEGYFQSLSDAFTVNHCDSKLFWHKNTNAKKIFETKGLRRIKNQIVIKNINKKLLNEVNRYSPDYIFVINGEILLEDTIDELNKKSIVILWVVDGIDNVKIINRVLDKILHVFLIEPTDLNKVPGSKLLTLAADSMFYKKMETKNKYDVSFVGAGHEKGLSILNEIAIYCRENGYKFGVFGKFKTFLRKPASERKKYIHLEQSIQANRKLPPNEVNEIFNSTKININIHHEQKVLGLNSRVFEISASGNFQLVDNQCELYNYFEERISMATYSNMDDLKKKIQYYLKNEGERKKIAENAHKLAIRNHLYKNRMETVLELVGPPKDS